MLKRPIVELSDCIRCEVCVAACPAAFRMNDAGFVEVIDLSAYPEDEVGGLYPLGRGITIRSSHIKRLIIVFTTSFRHSFSRNL
ncbi:MAG: ferredoxin [Desulfobacterales bacterium]|nr:ferredoxin [Desulfobacterales bacterium]